MAAAIAALAVPAGSETAMLATGTADSAAATQEVIGAAGPHSYMLGGGDRLKVRVFERDDLSGEYRVRPNGLIVLPIVGTVVAAGKDEAGLEQDIAARLERVTGGRATVIVEVIEWRPFYVAGYVLKPGAYGFLPGMTVLHAMAIAGGVYRLDPTAEAASVAVTREGGRMQANLDQLHRAMARLARLEAERDGRRIRVPERLVTLAGSERAAELIADESRILEQGLAAYQRQVEAFEETRRLSSREIEALEEKLGQIDTQIDRNESVLKDLENLLARQLTRRVRVVEVGTMIAGLESNRRDAVAAVSRAQRALADAERDRAMLDLRRRQDIEAMILETQKEIEGGEVATRSSKAVIEAITNAPVTISGNEADPKVIYAILRRGPDGNVFIPVEETTEMLPGDVLRVTRLAEPDLP